MDDEVNWREDRRGSAAPLTQSRLEESSAASGSRAAFGWTGVRKTFLSGDNSPGGVMLRSLRCCLNPKVIGVLVAAGLVVWLVAPASGTAAFPLLITLICPLSMGVMVWQMRRGGSGAGPVSSASETAAADGTDAEVARLREELAIERARRHLARRNGQPGD